MKGCIIGSFRKYYDDIVDAIGLFNKAKIEILSPKISKIINPTEEFVILESDDRNLSNEDIQLLVFHRAFRSDFIYVWDPDGYIGKTTCYEIGRMIDKDIPIYYLERPLDVPIYVSESSIISVEQFVDIINSTGKLPVIEFDGSDYTKELIVNLKKNKFFL